ncbi:cytochrome P450 3A11-like isoform X1 [Dermacentor andersoni]|uniref:cytochrome P450 3A11-like isoform X1 n=1 Tax=Dermacentor andersoni TaxID=34620 RepID=UPI0021559C84|nr:cytochrome P450 3A11-like isoform X1 [Dermacentor andersoni]
MATFLGLPDWIILAATVCVLLYLYAYRNRNYWKNQNVTSEPFALIFGPTLKLMFQPMHFLDTNRYNKYGKLFGTFETGKSVLFVAEPELVKQVMVKDFPALPNRRTFKFSDPILDNMMNITPVDRWRKIRPASSPAFSTGRLRKMNFLIEDCAVVTAQHLKEAAAKEEDIDIKQFFSNYALDVIARCAFGTKLDSHSDQTNEFVTKSRQIFSGRVTPRLIMFFVFPAISRLLGLRPFNMEIFLYFKQICLNIIKDRQDKQSRHEDFLQLMMDAKEGNLASAVEKASERDNQLFNLGSGLKPDTSFSSNKTLTQDEAMAQCVLFFFAGQDTTSSVISYTLYQLAINPEVQEKLREEVDECFTMHGERPSLDVITKLKYLHGVVSEALRMYPPATRIERSPVEDYVLGDTGIKVKKGDIIAIPVYSMHHDPQYFSDPFTFNPDRFSDENMDSIQPYTYLPFGAGPRNCIGMRFALQEVKLSLLYTIRNVKVVRTKKTRVPLEFQNGYSLLTAKDITLGIRKRG